MTAHHELARLLAEAAALRRSGKDGEAAEREREAVARAGRQKVVREAERALAGRDYEKAERALRAHLKANPDDPAALRLLARIAAGFEAHRDALRILRRVLELVPGFAAVRLDLAGAHYGLGEADQALAELDRLLAEAPGQVPALAFKAKLLVDLRRLDEAIALFERLLAMEPDHAMRWLNYGFLLKTVGRLEEAVAAHRESLRRDPGLGAAWWGLANLKIVRFDAADADAMAQALVGRDPGEEDAVQLAFARAKALGDVGRDADSFRLYAAANRARRASIAYDRNALAADSDASIRVFTPAYFAARSGSGSPAPDPIFIVSMPRSGSTLVEQILASHRLVEGTEELFEIQRLAGRVAGAKGRGPLWQDNLAFLGRYELLALGETYLNNTRMRRVLGTPFFTDKMPGNWAYLGLILSILPNARIVDVRRHPLACGVANFTQYYNQGVSFAYDLGEIGDAYRHYVRLMDHFDSVLPGRIHRILYENLVEDFEGEVRRLLAALGLPFDPACLRFHETERPIHTPSAQQVRQPINRAGLDSWRRYAPWLGPLEAALGPLAAAAPRRAPLLEATE